MIIVLWGLDGRKSENGGITMFKVFYNETLDGKLLRVFNDYAKAYDVARVFFESMRFGSGSHRVWVEDEAGVTLVAFTV